MNRSQTMHTADMLRAEKAEGRHPPTPRAVGRTPEFNPVAGWPEQSFQENTQC
jgi:hypothetical protein